MDAPLDLKEKLPAEAGPAVAPPAQRKKKQPPPKLTPSGPGGILYAIGSKQAPPCLGAQEWHPENPEEAAALVSSIAALGRADWRSLLSNMAPGDAIVVVHKGETYNFPTVEHAFQAAKFLVNGFPAVAAQFALGLDGAGPVVGKGGMDARGARKLRVLTKEERLQWDRASPGVMRALVEYKFAPGRLVWMPNQERADGIEAARVLLATRGAILLHGFRGKYPVQAIMMETREALHRGTLVARGGVEL